ncbi:MAG: glycine cleavage system protein GcvH [Thermodesulfobacteriota bacterium]
MKEISELVLPDDLKYAQDHEWARRKGGLVQVGITDYAQDQLGDITFVELPEVGDVLEQGEEFGTLESTKAVSELYLPVGGEITAVNRNLEDDPGLVNREPYGGGWMVELKPENLAELDDLLDREAYVEMLEGLGE